MAVFTRNLSVGATGSDVSDLQKELAQVGLSVPPGEQQASSFGPGTNNAVVQFQTTHGLPGTGIVDAATATALTGILAETTYTVTGVVSSPTSPSIGGLNVQLVDKNIGADVPLSTTTTDAAGNYSVTVAILLAQLQQHNKTTPDLQVRVSAETTFLAASNVAYNAATNVTLDVVLPADAPLSSEYETLTARLGGLYPGRLGALQPQDITYLANKIGWNEDVVAKAVSAAPHLDPPAGGGIPTPPPTSPAPAPGQPAPVSTGIRPEFLYALFRAGLPANDDALYRASPQTVQAIWQQAIAQNVIPASLQGEIPRALAAYQALSATSTLTAKSAVGPSAFKEILQITLTDPTQQQQFTQLYVQHQGDNAGFWSAVQTTFGVDKANQLKLDGRIAAVTFDNDKVMTALYNAERRTPLTSILDLASRGYYDAAKWEPLIGTSLPAQIPGATVDEQRANYANLMAAQIRLAYPTAVVAERVANGELPIQGAADVATGVHTFLTSNSDLEIGVEPVEAYIARTKIAGTPGPVLEQIKRFQRVYQLADDKSMPVLLKANLDSAQAITRYDSAGFVRAFQSQLGEKVARDIHARAKQIHGNALAIAMHYIGVQRAPILGRAPGSPILDPRSVPASNGNYPVIAYPTLENLFGSMDYCQCDECRSILSPAAYLVDLLHFVDHPAPTTGFQNPQAVLFDRRPDLQYLLLTCANTNIALPYIDIVNETLEYFVANNLTLVGFTGFNTADTITSAELLAAPQNVNDAAYTILQNSFFPTPLPFHRPLALLRLHLQAIGVALADVMTALRANEAIERSTPQTFAWRDILMEQVGLSRPEYRLFTDRTLGLHGMYGYGNMTDSDTLTKLQNQNLQDFSRRVAVSYDDLFAVIQTDFVNPNNTLTFVNPTDSSDLCSATALVLRHVDPDNTVSLLHGADFLQLIRFIGLWKRLRLTIKQTDDVVVALYPADQLPTGASDDADFQLLDSGFLTLLPRIGFLYKAVKLLGLSTDALPSLLACWAPIDTTGAHSLYASMFLTPTLSQQDHAFAADLSGKILQDTAQTLLAHELTLCAAFNITGAEFGLITTALGFSAATVLNLANISAIYRMGWLAHTLGLSLIEFLMLRTYSRLDPFASLDPQQNATSAEPPAIRFIELVQAMRAAGLEPVQALYLMWDQDITGKATPPDSTVTQLATTLRANFAAVESQFTLLDDSDGRISKERMTLVYGNTTTDFFFGLLNNTLTSSAGYGSPQGAIPQPVIDASLGRLSYDDLRKQVTFTGVLDATTQAAIDAAITANGNDANLHAALVNLAAANHQAVDPFFAAYPELLPLYAAYVTSSDPAQTRRTALLANFLPSLKAKRKQEQALASITAAVGADPSFASALLQDSTILHAASDVHLAGLDDLTAIESPGLSASYYLTNNTAAPPDLTIDAVANLDYAPGANPLPPGQGGSAIAAIWSGYVNAPQDGFYDISIAADPGITVSLQIAGSIVTLAAAGAVWTNQSAIILTAGALAPITLTVGGIKSNLSVSWRSLGLGWQVIPGSRLYSAALIHSLRATYLRFLKTASLAEALSLTANETAYIGTNTAFRVNTSDGHDKLATGNNVFTPLAMTNIRPGSLLVLDTGAAQEIVTVTATTATTFSAVTTKTHDGTASPFPIVNQLSPVIGRGWLNFLPAAGSPDLATAAELREALISVLDFARIKAALSPSDERLLSVLQNPEAAGPDGSPAVLALTGWALDSLQELLQRVYADKQLSHLSNIENLRRVYDAYAVVSACRVSAKTLINATTNDPAPNGVGALQSALRALYAEADWLNVVKPINDAMGRWQRDALVAYILQQLGDKTPTTPPSPADAADVNTLDKLFEYFLIDAGTEPAVETSRIRLALSAVQIFIERCSRNLEPFVSAADIDPNQWTWMKRYRLWAANREVFLWPENWLYPELRDDQSPFFEQMMSELLQGDITDDAAEAAYLSYLTSLDSVAKLEPCGIYYVPSDAGKMNEISYVVGRTAGAHRKYYFRQLSNGGWSPWSETKIDADDLPVTPILWKNGQLFLVWLKTRRDAPTASLLSSITAPTLAELSPKDLQSAASNAAPQQVAIFAVLCWSEFYNGKWQPTKTSDVNRPTFVGNYPANGDGSFEAIRSWLRLEPVSLIGDMEGALYIYSPPFALFAHAFGFVLYNTHSLPVRLEDITPTTPDSGWPAFRVLTPEVSPYTGGNRVPNQSFQIEYVAPDGRPYQTNQILTPKLNARYVEPPFWLSGIWDAPFLYEDRRNVFYVTTGEVIVSVGGFSGYGIGFNTPIPAASTVKIPPVVRPQQQPALVDIANRVALGTFSPNGSANLQRFPRVDPVLGLTAAIGDQGQSIAMKGFVATASSLEEKVP
jgi:peptidoglycan hydrolase-like protein with peptidoglycan-binding domain